MSTLRLMTLNIAHGRGLGPNQIFQRQWRFRRNLGRIAEVVLREGPDVLAIQEADGPSFWSGRFNHVDFLAEQLGVPHHTRGNHAPAISQIDFGTAILSKLPLTSPRSRPFFGNWRDAKGFVEAQVSVDGIDIDIVSLHLDFLRDGLRRRQVQALYDRFDDRERPLVVLGDFNCGWSDGVGDFCRRLGLNAWEPEATGPTFPTVRPTVRIDWVLASPELEFLEHRVTTDPISDHCGIVVELAFQTTSPSTTVATAV